MKTLKRIISILVIFALFASFTAVNVGAVSTPASLMGKYINFGTFDADGDGTAEPMVYYVAARDDVNGDAIGDYYLLSANSLMKAGISSVDAEIAEDQKTDSKNTTGREHSAWSQSSLRTWLNSSDATVVYDTSDGVRIIDENYANRAGFMNNFNNYKSSLILPVTHKTVLSQWHTTWNKVDGITYSGTEGWNWAGDVHTGTSATYYGTYVKYEQETTLSKRWRYLDYYTNIDGYTFDQGTDDTSDDVVHGEAYKEETTDKVFIPSIIDCYKYKLPLHDMLATNSTSMWLRDIANGRKDSTYFNYNALFNRENTSRIAADKSNAQQQIRPAMFIDGAADYQVTGDGTKDKPYTLVESKSCDDLTGKYIYFGEYGETFDGNTEAVTKQPIKWYIAGTKDVDADGTEEYYMIASEAISIKGFTSWSANSPGAWSTQWASSALRAWLNSDESDVSAYGKYVTYADSNVVYTDESTATVKKLKVAEPTAANLGNGRGYADEAGFLTNFTAAEKAMITPVTHKYLMSTTGYKDTEATGSGFTGGITAAQGEYYNLLEKYGNTSDAAAVPKLIVNSDATNNVYQGIHTGRGADNENDYFWVDVLANINGVRGNNFNTEYFDSKAPYIETTDTVFIPSLFDVADFGGEILYMNKQSNNPAYGYQCGAGNPADPNMAGHVWLRDTNITADSGSSGTNKLQLVYSASNGFKGNVDAGGSTNIGVQPAMYVSLDTAATFGIGTYAEPLVLKTDVSGADGSVDIAYNGANVTATGYVYNTTNAQEKFTLIIARYELVGEEGAQELVLKEAVSAPKTLDAEAGTDIVTASVGYEQDCVYRAFLWNSESIAPYTSSKTLN